MKNANPTKEQAQNFLEKLTKAHTLLVELEQVSFEYDSTNLANRIYETRVAIEYGKEQVSRELAVLSGQRVAKITAAG